MKSLSSTRGRLHSSLCSGLSSHYPSPPPTTYAGASQGKTVILHSNFPIVHSCFLTYFVKYGTKWHHSCSPGSVFQSRWNGQLVTWTRKMPSAFTSPSCRFFLTELQQLKDKNMTFNVAGSHDPQKSRDTYLIRNSWLSGHVINHLEISSQTFNSIISLL